MPLFAYTARSADGQTVSASLDAPSRRDAARMLAARGLQPVTLQEANGSGTPAARELRLGTRRRTLGPRSRATRRPTSPQPTTSTRSRRKGDGRAPRDAWFEGKIDGSAEVQLPPSILKP